MTDDLEAVPERHFTLRQRLILAIVPFIAALCYKLLFTTCRLEIRGREHLAELEKDGRLGLGGFWHETIGIMACAHKGKGYYTLTSYSFDGELAARFAAQFGVRSVRGSSSRGAVQALTRLEKAAVGSSGVVYTLDGPRGPRRIAKAGISLVSVRTGYWVVPIAAAASSAWRLKSWDRFIIPKPGARVIVAYGAAVPPPPDERGESARASARALTERLNALIKEIEAELDSRPRRD